MEKLTKRQRKVFNQLKRFHKKNQYMPTRAELARVMELYPNAIQKALNILQDKGYIKITPYEARAIRIIEVK